MTAATIRGLAALQRRLAAPGAAEAVKRTLRAEAEALADAARAALPPDLADSVSIRDASQGTRPAFEIGSADPQAQLLEYGTLRHPASPWLLPAFRARLRLVKNRLRNSLQATLKRPTGAL